MVRMSASAYRYAPRPDRNVELRARILALAQRHKRYGVGMIYLKVRQDGMFVNYKRVERLYQEAKLQVRRRKRKKVLPGERQPLVRPLTANQVWSMDFVFDRTAEGRVLKCLTIVDDATHEAVAIEVERAISGLGVTRVLDRLALTRGLPQVIRTDNGKEFCGKAMVTWAYERGVQLRLIQPGKPNQNASSTGSPTCCMPGQSSRLGGTSTTRNDRRRLWEGRRQAPTRSNWHPLPLTPDSKSSRY